MENIVVSNVPIKNLRFRAVVRTLASKGKNLDGVFISQVAITGSNQVLTIGWDRGEPDKEFLSDDITPLKTGEPELIPFLLVDLPLR